MKKIYLIAIAALCASAVRAQTNADAAANSATRPPTLIESASVDFDMTGRRAVYRGDVRVDDPQMKLTCAHLVVDLPPDAGHPNHIVAETNVVIDFTDAKGQTMHATSDKAVYDFNIQNGTTNETVTFTGNAKVENTQGWLTGEPIIWNRANNSLSATNQKMIFRQNLDSLKPAANPPPPK
jgi:lipopolysaccharide transport protein LptA